MSNPLLEVLSPKSNCNLEEGTNEVAEVAQQKSSETGIAEYSFDEDKSVQEDEVSEEKRPGRMNAVKKQSEESVIKREFESPIDLTRVKWEEVDLLFLQTDCGSIFRYTPAVGVHSSHESGVVYLDFSFIQGHINKREYDYFSEKYRLFFQAYQNKMKYIQRLVDDNAIYRATLDDHKKIEEWFESMPMAVDGKGTTTANKDLPELHDIRKERLNAIAYRLILSDISEKSDIWSKEIQRIVNDRDFLVNEIRKCSPGEEVTTGPKQAVAKLMLDIYTMEDELVDILGKIKAVDDFTHGFVARNKFLEKKLENLEEKHAGDAKELMDLKLENERGMKSRNELRTKAAEMGKELEELEQRNQSFLRQFQKMQYESVKGMHKSMVYKMQVDAMNTEKQLRNVRLLRLKEKIDMCRMMKGCVDKNIENGKRERKALEKELLRKRAMLEKLDNKARLLQKTINTIEMENEAEKTQISALKESCRSKGDQVAAASERQKIEKEIANLRREMLNTPLLQASQRQEYVKLYNDIKHLQQDQWSMRKVYQDNIGKIRKASLEQTHQLDSIQRLLLEIQKQKSSIKWVTQQRLADEKLLAKKNAELSKIMVQHRNERLEKSKDLQERTMRLQSISEWKEINRVGDSEKEELTLLVTQLTAKREDVQKISEVVRNEIGDSKGKLKWTKAELGRSRIENEAREKGNQKIKLELYKLQLENERIIQKLTEAATERNYMSMKLNDTLREHVCYTEHISTSEEMIRRADWELVTRMDVISRLASIKKMELLGIDKTRQKLESWQGMLDSLEDLSKRFEDVTARQIDLQKKFHGTRHRMVRENQKEDPKEVQRKLELLENRVNAQEEKLIELKLLNNRTSKLLENLQRDRDEKLGLAQASNNAFVDSMRKNIGAEKKTKQMAVDLSLKKAMAESIKKELEVARRQYKEAAERVEKGESPTPEIEAEWLRSVKKIGEGRMKLSDPPGLHSTKLQEAITLIKC